MGLFGSTSDRGELLELQARVGRLEEQVARLSAALAAAQAGPLTEVVQVSPAGDGAVGAPVSPAVDGYAEARALAAAGNKIHAIKVVRDQSGLSLKAAKELVESW